MMVLKWTLNAILHFRTLSATAAVIHSVFPGSPFLTTETQVVGFGALEAILDAKGRKFRALVGPVHRGFAHPAFVPG